MFNFQIICIWWQFHLFTIRCFVSRRIIIPYFGQVRIIQSHIPIGAGWINLIVLEINHFCATWRDFHLIPILIIPTHQTAIIGFSIADFICSGIIIIQFCLPDLGGFKINLEIVIFIRMGRLSNLQIISACWNAYVATGICRSIALIAVLCQFCLFWII